MPMMTIELNMLMGAVRAGVIMKLCVRLALQRGREHRVHHGAVHVSRISVAVLHFRMDVDPRHDEHPQ